MKKNAFLTFIFACIPGAGQMYYGYMKRGLSMITFFCLFIMAGTLVDVLVVGSVIVWMYSFFDTYDLIRHLAARGTQGRRPASARPTGTILGPYCPSITSCWAGA